MLPIAGEVLVSRGDQVTSRQVVARADLPGDITPINLSNLLSLPPGDVPSAMLKREGDMIAPGDVLARTKGIFGFFQSEYAAKVGGVIESISGVTGQVLIRGEPIPVEVRAFAAGEVAEILPGEGCVVEADVALVQGIFGIGGEAFGPIRMACRSHDQEFTPDLISPDMKGAIIVGGARVTGQTVQRALAGGVAAIVSGGIDDADLREILGYDLGVAITGSEKIGITVVVTEGFGEIAMAERTFDLLASLEGKDAAVNGATQIRAGVMRPEIIVPAGEGSAVAASPQLGGGVLEAGTRVRIIRDPYFGVIGTVSAMPTEPQRLGSGSKARVLEVSCEAGRTVTVPRANVEIVGT
jgi:hypothetical protein